MSDNVRYCWVQRVTETTKPRALVVCPGLACWKKAATYSPALHCSTIGAGGLNFSVRNGKRWDTAAITTWLGGWLSNKQDSCRKKLRVPRCVCSPFGLAADWWHRGWCPTTRLRCGEVRKFRAISSARLWRRRLYTCALSTSSSGTTLMRSSYLAAGFALRCFQRLSDPDSDTRRCTWRHNR